MAIHTPELRPATPAKLHDGSWGARLEGTPPAEGDRIQITTRGGKSWTTAVRAIVWAGEGVALVRTGSGAPARRRADAECRWAPEEGSSVPCSQCGGFCFAADEGRCSVTGARCRCPECC